MVGFLVTCSCCTDVLVKSSQFPPRGPGPLLCWTPFHFHEDPAPHLFSGSRRRELTLGLGSSLLYLLPPVPFARVPCCTCSQREPPRATWRWSWPPFRGLNSGNLDLPPGLDLEAMLRDRKGGWAWPCWPRAGLLSLRWHAGAVLGGWSGRSRAGGAQVGCRS